jgi:hypothetical protein
MRLLDRFFKGKQKVEVKSNCIIVLRKDCQFVIIRKDYMDYIVKDRKKICPTTQFEEAAFLAACAFAGHNASEIFIYLENNNTITEIISFLNNPKEILGIDFQHSNWDVPCYLVKIPHNIKIIK